MIATVDHLIAQREMLKDELVKTEALLRECLQAAPTEALPWNGEIGHFGSIPMTNDEVYRLRSIFNA